MPFMLQIMLVILWIGVLIALVVGVWYGASLLFLAVVSRLFPLTGRHTRRLLAAFLCVVLALFAACRGPARPHSALGPRADPLRAEFNRDIGHVRIVTLVAPT